MTQICGKWLKYMGNGLSIWFKYVGIHLEILGNGLNIWKMAEIYEARLKYFRYGISMLQMT